MDLLKKYEKLGHKYCRLFHEATFKLEKIDIENDLDIFDILFRTKKVREFKTYFLRAEYYKEVSNRILNEWKEEIRKEKVKNAKEV